MTSYIENQLNVLYTQLTGNPDNSDDEILQIINQEYQKLQVEIQDIKNKINRIDTIENRKTLFSLYLFGWDSTSVHDWQTFDELFITDEISYDYNLVYTQLLKYFKRPDRNITDEVFLMDYLWKILASNNKNTKFSTTVQIQNIQINNIRDNTGIVKNLYKNYKDVINQLYTFIPLNIQLNDPVTTYIMNYMVMNIHGGSIDFIFKKIILKDHDDNMEEEEELDNNQILIFNRLVVYNEYLNEFNNERARLLECIIYIINNIINANEETKNDIRGFWTWLINDRGFVFNQDELKYLFDVLLNNELMKKMVDEKKAKKRKAGDIIGYFSKIRSDIDLSKNILDKNPNSEEITKRIKKTGSE